MILGKITIKNERDILHVRHAMKTIARQMDFETIDSVRIATAASELTRNILEYADSGVVSFDTVTNYNKTGLKLVFQDKGKGIADIDKVLSKDYKSESGMGIGLQGARHMMDEFTLESTPGEGTIVTVIKWLKDGKTISKESQKLLKNEFTLISEESAIDELKSQNRELIEVLDTLRQQNIQMEKLNKELDTTNDGLIALYREVDLKNEELDIKSQRKSLFVRSLGHETRTPLNSIITLTDMLLKQMDGPLNEEQQLQLEMIRESSNFLLNLVNDLLDLSKIEEGFVDYRVSKFSLEELYYHVSASLSSLAQVKELDLTLVPNEKLPDFETDMKLLSQVLINIIGNAIKYTDQGSVVVTVEMRQDNHHEFFEIRVKDTGIGIPNDKFGQVFEQFRRIYSRDDIIRGSGLGLPIAKTIVENIGGSISVISDVGVGTEFTVKIPLIFPLNLKPVDAAKVKDSRQSMDSILIVEDDEAAIDYLTEALNDEKYLLIIARDADTAIRLINRQRFLAVCLDLLLPREKDGWNVLKAIRHNPVARNTPVLMMTVLHDAKSQALAVGADIFLEKPINIANLKAILDGYKSVRKLESILIVDDEKAIIHNFRKIFGKEYQVLSASDGEAALKIVKKRSPDLIILDLIMPVMDGFEFLENLIRDQILSQIPVIIYSSKDLSNEEEEFLEKYLVTRIDKNETRVDELPLIIKKIFGNYKGGK